MAIMWMVEVIDRIMVAIVGKGGGTLGVRRLSVSDYVKTKQVLN